ncbi:hypothetical protein [Paenibacillus glycanilyticus]|uniref:Uncharacterized protein n=1 Tax=Paenibacillus glycanilyticus TaxID=126569 RepID=A0ABQ6GKX7_9BACL|nr:hypothetical protein [Paenibacillus glycanilyticus]GLX70262.1 hypothetical protein MU1_46080 [Paenibacillus glycanilyticus]
MDKSALVGAWSVDEMYGPGAASDEVVFFAEDGTGWFEFSNWGISSIETFEWSLSGDQKLTIQGLDKYAIYQPDGKSDLEVINLPVRIVNKLAPSGERLNILEFDAPGIYDIQEFGLLDMEIKPGLLEERLELLREQKTRYQEEEQEEDEEDDEKQEYAITGIMLAYAEDAVEVASGLGVELDYSEASLTELDAILERYHLSIPRGWKKIFRRGPSEEQITQISKMWGGYLGEIIRANLGGNWGLSDQFEDAIALKFDGEDTEIYPPAKVYKRIMNGSEDHVAGYYQMIKVTRSGEF